MKQDRFLDALSNIDTDIVEEFVCMDNQLRHRRQNKKNAWIRWSTVAACLLLVIGIALPAILSRSTKLPTDIDKIIWGTSADHSSSSIITDFRWGGWKTQSRLHSKLTQADPDQYIAIQVTMTELMSFVYQEKTYTELSSEISEKDYLLNKLGELCKEGNWLKYGELLYTEGTPDGVKYAKALYDERVAYFGEDLLSKYIVDGEFYQEEVEKAQELCLSEIRKLEKMRDELVQAYHRSYLKKARNVFSDAGACAIVKNNKLFIFVTPEELADLSIVGQDRYFLTLARKRNYEHIKGDIPTFRPTVTGFALDKISCEVFDGSSRHATSDKELIEKLNAMIETGEFDTDRVVFSMSSSEELPKEVFAGMKYEMINITRKYKTSSFIWLTVKYENIDLEALKSWSQMPTITSISIYLDIYFSDHE